MEYICKIPSPLGELTAVSDGENLTGLWITGRQYAVTGEKDAKEADLPVFEETRKWFNAYFAGKDPGFTPLLAPAGSEFRQSVWKLLLEIPYGQVVTYGFLAEKIAEQKADRKKTPDSDLRAGTPTVKTRMSAQAVGGAVGHNPISIIIPCHRVVGSDGSLTGYGGGLDIKVKLLETEKVNMEGMYLPKQ